MGAPAPTSGAGAEGALTIRPPGGAWGAMLAPDAGGGAARRDQGPLRAERGRFRAQMGLPPGPLVMTGHQPEFWHPGILAKYLAAAVAARRFGARAVWLVVDQARPEAVAARYPALVEGRLVARQLAFTAAGPAPALPADAAAPFVADGLARIVSAMSDRGEPPDLARRVAGVVAELASPLLSGPAATIFATDLSRTDLFRALVARMGEDPGACIRAYNAAAARHPGVGIRPLIADEVQDRWELPLWRLGPSAAPGLRQRVYAEMLGQTRPEELAPRALLMTALVRLAGCDLFIHGTGGGGADEVHEGYDAAMEDWLGAWLGPAALAPIAVVSATRLLPLSAGPAPSPAEAAAAAWQAHRARHDPAILDEAAPHPAAAMKRSLVARIAAEPRRTARRRDLYAELHRALAEYRAALRDELARLARRAADARARLADAEVVTDRTWPFPLYPAEALTSLRAEIEQAFAARS